MKYIEMNRIPHFWGNAPKDWSKINGVEYVRINRVKKYLEEFGFATCGEKLTH